MPLEVNMLIINSSEFMRNGDYNPMRFEAQADLILTSFPSNSSETDLPGAPKPFVVIEDRKAVVCTREVPS